MEFGTEKYAIQIVKNGRRETIETVESQNQESIIRNREKGNSWCFGILDENIIKQTEMEDKVRKEYLRRTNKFLKIKFCSRNLIK